MSKWVLPPGQTIRSPVAIRFEGLPADSPAADELYRQHQAEIDHFYLKAAQAAALGVLNSSYLQQSSATLALRYQNNQGHEIVYVRVLAPSPKQPEEPVKEEPWDWAVVDVHVPLFTRTYLDGSGDISSNNITYVKLLHPTPKPTEWQGFARPAFGEAGEDLWSELYYSAEAPPLVQWGYATTRAQVGTQRSISTQVEIESLLIDLRKFATYDELVFELYGGLAAMDDDHTTELTQVAYYVIQRPSTPAELTDPATETANTGPLPLGTPSPYTSYHDESQIPLDYPVHGGGFDIPPPAEGSLTPGWYEIVGAMVPVDVPQGQDFYTTIFGTPDQAEWSFHENILHYEYYRTYDNVVTPVPVTPSSIASIEAAMFRGVPPWAWSDNLIEPTGVAYGLWEIASRYPDRFKTGRIATGIPVPPATDSAGPTNNHGLTLFGTVHVFPKQGGVVFKRAG